MFQSLPYTLTDSQSHGRNSTVTLAD